MYVSKTETLAGPFRLTSIKMKGKTIQSNATVQNSKTCASSFNVKCGSNVTTPVSNYFLGVTSFKVHTVLDAGNPKIFTAK